MTDAMSTTKPSALQAARQEYYGRISHMHLAPLWEQLHDLVTKAPRSAIMPAHWDYDGVVRAALFESAGLITAKEAERRVLILENPALRGKAAITQSLYAGLQLVAQGEVAPAHRHSQSALRFIVEGGGAYTTVDGERTLMQPGDLVITPPWTWHDHGNESENPMVWLDGLDIPMIGFLDTSFAEPSKVESQALARGIGYSSASYGHNMLPVGWTPPPKDYSPILNYPYTQSRVALTQLMCTGAAPSPWHGYKLRYVNPATGGHILPSISAFLQLLPAGFTSKFYRQTDAAVYMAVEGRGSVDVAGQRIAWKPRDVFVVPNWAMHTFMAETESVLFSFSDRPLQEKLGLWREDASESQHDRVNGGQK